MEVGLELENFRAGTLIETPRYHSEVVPSMDFETYSEAGYEKIPNEPHGDLVIKGRKRWVPPYSIKGTGSQGKGGLPVVGTPVYAEHPTCEILSLYYDLKDGKGRRRWLPAFPNPADLLEHVATGGLIEAWNVTFEFWIWNMVAVRKLGWPPLELSQCRCAMAKSRRYSLPASLDGAAKVLGTPEKDKDGKRLLEKLSRPHSPTKTRPAHRWTPATAWEDFCKLYDYNDGDVRAEDNATARIPDLTPQELATWQVDQTINLRGVLVDVQTLDAALDIHAQAVAKYHAQLVDLTDGAVETVNQNKRFIDWVRAQGVETSSLDKDHRARLLASDIPSQVRRGLEIAEAVMSANIKKLYSLKRQVSSDGRLRDQYKYCGADRTGRWSAGGVQLQNMTGKGPAVAKCRGAACGLYFGQECAVLVPPDGGSPDCPRCSSLDWVALPKGEWPIEAVEQAIEDIRRGNLEHIEQVWGSPVDVLCGVLRGLFMAAPGKKFICADFSAIEAVAAACLSRCQWRIDVFNTPGECIYTRSASKITGTPVETYKQYRAENGSHHPDRKNIGKIAELASGYGGWINAWKAFGCSMEDAEIKKQVLAWREASPEIVEMWGGEYKWCGPGKWDYRYELHGLEGCAMQAIMNPGQCFTYNDITYSVKDDILFCRLPSGRFLHYHRPRLSPAEDKLRRGPAHSITFEGYNSNAQKGAPGWRRMETFGGRLFENVVQAVSADIQAEALLRCERSGYTIVMHTHDEACAEVPEGATYTVERMEQIMAERPNWADWWPIRAAGWEHQRYQKD